jgi:DNA-binding beta-propeller fold protein YncE
MIGATGCRTRPAGLWIVALLALVGAWAPQAASAAPRPSEALAVERPWPAAPLPNGWIMGDVTAVAVGPKDTVWILQRPRSLTEADRPHAAPPVLVFSRDGRFLRGFGGPGAGYDWPQIEHTLAVDAKGRAWISGSFRADPAKMDSQILVFDPQGRFLRQIGRPGASQGNADTGNFGAPADMFIDDARREVYVADGYVNRRLIVLDSETGAFKRMWSAFGAPPPNQAGPPPRAVGTPAPPLVGEGDAAFNGVHGVEIARDGTVYVSDRLNQRIQAFTREGRYLRQAFVDRESANPQSVSGIAFSPDPQQRHMYVADWGNGRLLILDRRTLALVDTFDAKFTGPHLLATDSRGTLYVSEVAARRVTRIAPAGK